MRDDATVCASIDLTGWRASERKPSIATFESLSVQATTRRSVSVRALGSREASVGAGYVREGTHTHEQTS